jgi:hypothetical protein
MPWTGDEQGPRIDKTRLRAAAGTRFALTVKELRHMLWCDACLETLSGLRSKFRAAKSKARANGG